MELWLVFVLYTVGLSFMVAETMMPGAILGLIGAAAVVTSIVFGFQHHWGLGAGQIAVVLGVVPVAFVFGMKRLALKKTLGGSASFAADASELVGREGEAETDLRPAGTARIDGRKVDVMTAGELVEKGKRVRVVKVEGGTVVVRAL